MKLDIQKVLTVSITHIPEKIAIKIERVCNKTAIYYTGISNLSIYKKQNMVGGYMCQKI